MKRSYFHYLTILAATLLLVSCKENKTCIPSSDFNYYISSFTGGTIGRDGTVEICFNGRADVSKNKKLFSFTPRISGETRWLSDSVVCFIPDEGELKAGQRYKATFKLDEVVNVSKNDDRTFSFSFFVSPMNAAIIMNGLRIDEKDSDKVSISGAISLSDAVSEEEMGKMLKISCKPEHDSPVISAEDDGKRFFFAINGIKREDKDASVSIEFNGRSAGFEKVLNEEVTVPAIGSFKVIEARNVPGEDPYIEVVFSNPLDKSAEEKGLLSLQNVSRYYVKVDGNIARLYYSGTSRTDDIILDVSAGIMNVFGDALKLEFSSSFNTGKLEPSVRFAFSGNILPDEESLRIPFQAIGLNAVDISIVKIFGSNMMTFLQDNNMQSAYELRRSGRLVYSNVIRLDGDNTKSNQRWEDYSVDLSGLFHKDPGAMYRVKLSFTKNYSIYADPDFVLPNPGLGSLTKAQKDVWDSPETYYYDGTYYDWDEYNWNETDDPTKASYYMESSRFPSRNLFSSSIGMISKMASDEMIWVSATDIVHAEALPDAQIKVYNFQLQEIGGGTTDKDGFAVIRTSGKPFLLKATHQGDVGYLKMTDGEEKSLSRFDTSGEKVQSGIRAFIYGERGVWRPGDTLHLSILLNSKADNIPADHPVLMELYAPQGQFYCKSTNASGMNGLYRFDVPTEDSDPTGIWNAYFKIGGAAFHKAVHIEAIKPNRLKINLEAQNTVLSAGKSETFSMNSSRLTGSPSAGMAASVEINLSRNVRPFKKYSNYTFENPLSEFTNIKSELFRGKLDSLGRLKVTEELPTAENAPGMLSARLVSKVTEPGGDASITVKDMPFSPFTNYVGIALPDENERIYETDKDLHFPVIDVDEKGNAVSGRKLQYSVYSIKWSWWWESRIESLDSYVNGNNAKCIETGTIVSGVEPVDLKFRVNYPDWGRYLILVEDEQSGHATGGIIYVDWPSWRGRSDKSDPDALTMLSFTTDKKSYEAGEIANLYIPAADDGMAIISFENSSRVISRSRVSTKAGEDTRFSFAVSEEMAPNFYIHVTLLQKHRRKRNDLPIRMYGVQNVNVSVKDSRLYPEISCPEIIRPQEEFSIKVKEKNGNPMTYTLAIVDEGLLDITAFKTPDPWYAMNAKEALGIRTWDLFDDVVGAYSGKFVPVMAIGGDEGVLMGNREESRFNPVVKYLGPFELKKGESDVHKIALPMYVGSVRVMVVAGQDGKFGNAQKAVPVRSPLMVLSTLPRTLGTSESVVLPVNVFALENNIKETSVEVKVEGPLKISGPTSQKLNFTSASDKICRFTLETGQTEGKARITVKASGGGFKTSESISIDVNNPLVPVSRTYSSPVKGGKKTVISFKPIEKDRCHLSKLQLSSFPSVDFSAIAASMEAYPYSCSEQLSSIGLTLINCKPFLNEAAARKADSKIKEIIRILYSRQNTDGSFKYWPGIRETDEWVTSMAGQFFLAASGAGFEVNSGNLAAWKKFQRKKASEYRFSNSDPTSGFNQAYRLYTLTLAGQADESAMNRLKVAGSLSKQAKWSLAAAYAICGKTSVAKDLTSSPDDSASPAVDAYTFGNSNRNKALMLETSLLLGDMETAMRLSQEVAESMEENRTGTQYCAFASSAMNLLSRKISSEAFDVKLSGAVEERLQSARSSVSMDINPVSGSIGIENLAKGAIYATIVTSEKTVHPVEASASNLAVSVRFTDKSGKVIDPSSIRQGQEFKATVQVKGSSTQDLENLALTFVAASGWEIINERLTGTESASAFDYAYKDIRDDRTIWYFDLQQGRTKEFDVRLQASYEGKFIIPVTKCEAMYDAKTYASTSSSTTEVIR